jgi:hypothetical protein
VAEVDGHALVPEVRRHPVDRVPVVARGIVDQHREVAELRGHSRDGLLVVLDPAHVASDEERYGMARRTDPVDQRQRCRLVDVDEAHPGALRREVLDDRGTDARTAARDEDGAAGEAGIGGET